MSSIEKNLIELNVANLSQHPDGRWTMVSLFHIPGRPEHVQGKGPHPCTHLRVTTNKVGDVVTCRAREVTMQLCSDGVTTELSRPHTDWQAVLANHWRVRGSAKRVADAHADGLLKLTKARPDLFDPTVPHWPDALELEKRFKALVDSR